MPLWPIFWNFWAYTPYFSFKLYVPFATKTKLCVLSLNAKWARVHKDLFLTMNFQQEGNFVPHIIHAFRKLNNEQIVKISKLQRTNLKVQGLVIFQRQKSRISRRGYRAPTSTQCAFRQKHFAKTKELGPVGGDMNQWHPARSANVHWLFILFSVSSSFASITVTRSYNSCSLN